MAHRKKPTRETTGSSAKLAAAVKVWKAEHKNPNSKTENTNRKKFKLPGEFPGTKEEFNKKYKIKKKFKLPGEFPGTKEEFDKKYKVNDGMKKLNGKTYNLNDRSDGPNSLTAYNKAKKASLSGNNNNRNKLSSNKKGEKGTVTKTRPKPGSAGARIQQKLMDAGHSRTSLDAKTDAHDAWKKARKEGTLGDWEKTHHPDRTPQYRNRKKSSSESNKGSSESNKGSTNRTKLQSKSAYDTKFDNKLTDSKVYGNKNKNKKKKKNLTTNEIKYPTRGTFRGI